MSHRRRRTVLVLACTAVACSGETLKELLISRNVPIASFASTELSETVQSSVASDPQRLTLAYQKLQGELLSGAPEIIQYNRIDRTLLRAHGAVADDDVCSGSILGIYFIAGFTLVATHISPSAACLLTFDKDLKAQQTLYGFGPVEVDPNLIVIEENTIHFAPVHPARLQSVDLSHGTQLEVYPPVGDKLRERFIKEHAARMPAPAICARMNDPCKPELFDEDIPPIATDGKGSFAFVARQSASHALVPEQETVTVAEQAVLYVYRLSRGGWRYCEKAIPSGEADYVEKSLSTGFADVLARCTTSLPLTGDMSTADYNPFLKR